VDVRRSIQRLHGGALLVRFPPPSRRCPRGLALPTGLSGLRRPPLSALRRRCAGLSHHRRRPLLPLPRWLRPEVWSPKVPLFRQALR